MKAEEDGVEADFAAVTKLLEEGEADAAVLVSRAADLVAEASREAATPCRLVRPCSWRPCHLADFT